MRERIKKTAALFRRLSLPGRLAAIHTLIILAAMALYPAGLFIPDPPYDDVYLIYVVVPGIHILWIGMYLSHSLFPLLSTLPVSRRAASILCVVFIPGLVGIVVGGLQWYFIGKIILLLRGERQRNLS
jgi:hypothetical protein